MKHWIQNHVNFSPADDEEDDGWRWRSWSVERALQKIGVSQNSFKKSGRAAQFLFWFANCFRNGHFSFEEIIQFVILIHLSFVAWCQILILQRLVWGWVGCRVVGSKNSQVRRQGWKALEQIYSVSQKKVFNKLSWGAGDGIPRKGYRTFWTMCTLFKRSCDPS